jgi:hypothetical protein
MSRQSHVSLHLMLLIWCIRPHGPKLGDSQSLYHEMYITLQRHNAKNSKQIFPGKDWRGHSRNFHIHMSVSDSWSVCLFCCRKICGPILGIYKSLTDTWMWKLGLRRRNSFIHIVTSLIWISMHCLQSDVHLRTFEEVICWRLVSCS